MMLIVVQVKKDIKTLLRNIHRVILKNERALVLSILGEGNFLKQWVLPTGLTFMSLVGGYCLTNFSWL